MTDVRLCDAWFEARDRLSHDFLQNKILNALANASDQTVPFTTLDPYLRLFLGRRGEILSLLLAGPMVLDPGKWVLRNIENRIRPSAACVLRQYASLVFHSSVGLRRLFLDGLDKLDRAKAAVGLAISTQGRDRLLVTQATAAIRDLAGVLSTLPATRDQLLRRLWE